MKKVLSLFLAFVFVMSICAAAPITANAASESYLLFELNEDGKSYAVRGCSYEATGEIIIPESYNGLPVTKIGNEAFFNIPHITAVHMPSTVTTIGEHAFWESGEIEVITGYENVSEIGNGAFQGCRKLKTPIFPRKVTAIGDSVFAYCRSFESIEIPEYITSIGDSAFCECIKAKTIKLHDGIKSIGIFAFSSCASLTEISLPEGLTKIPESLFATCTSLEKIDIPESVTIIEREAFSGCESLEEFVIVDGVKTIETYTFSNCKNLKSIVIPESVTKIAGYAFLNCKSLEKVTFKGSRTQWNSIEISNQDNGNLINANIVCAVEDKPLTLSTPIATTKNTAKGITVTWGAVENAEKYIVYQRVYNKTTKKYSGWKAIKTTTDLTYTDTTVKLGTKYSYTVKAVTGSVKSGIKATSGLTYNVTPTVKVAVASNGIKVSWSTAANATGYTVYSSTYNTKTKKWSGWTNRGTIKANATSWVDKNAKSGTYYKYTVRARNNSVASSYNKNGASTLYLSQPTVKIANNAKGVKVAWSKVTGATGYTVYRSEYKDGAWTKWASRGTAKANKTSWTDTKVTSGVQYKYTVRAINGKYKSTYVSSNTVLYLAQPNVTVKAVSNGIKVAWTQSTGATGYTVYRMEYNAKTKKWSGWKKMGTAKASKTNWTDKSAKKGVTYKYTTKAINGKTASTYVASGSVKR